MISPIHHRRTARFAVGSAAMAAALAVAACVPNAPRAVIAPAPGAPGMVQAPAVIQAPVANLATDVKVTATEFKFAPSTIQVPAGKKITFTLENKGVVEHDIVLEAAGFKLLAKAGQTVKGEFTFDRPGTYELICSIPGHKAAGMTGTLTVVGAGAAGAGAPQQAASTASQPQQPAVTTAGLLPAGLKPLPAPQIALPTFRSAPAVVPITVEAREIPALVADGVGTTLWTFGGTVPGPMLRVRQGDTVELTFKNAPDSIVTHSIDLHAVTGPGGGAKATQLAPGESAVFRFQALNPGVYVYHCATPMVAHHISTGMYGLIVVEPPEGYPRVDREFYVMQGDLYLQGQRGEQGMREFSVDKMLDETPDYVTFNGSTGALVKDNALTMKVGETARIFFGVGGPNLTSSFHLIGEIFDRVYPEGASSPVLQNVQTTHVPAGGATIVEFKAEVPGTYTLVDHSLGRLEKGAAGQIVVEGAENPQVFQVIHGSADGGGH